MDEPEVALTADEIAQALGYAQMRILTLQKRLEEARSAAAAENPGRGGRGLAEDDHAAAPVREARGHLTHRQDGEDRQHDEGEGEPDVTDGSHIHSIHPLTPMREHLAGGAGGWAI